MCTDIRVQRIMYKRHSGLMVGSLDQDSLVISNELIM